MGRVKVWLTGDIADRYDLVVRTKLLNGSCTWSDPVYVYNSKDKPLTLETAPACGLEPDGSSNTKISGMNVHLIRKPTGARVVREFSTDESLTITDDFGSGYLYVAAMLGLRLPSKTPIAFGPTGTAVQSSLNPVASSLLASSTMQTVSIRLTLYIVIPMSIQVTPTRL